MEKWKASESIVLGCFVVLSSMTFHVLKFGRLDDLVSFGWGKSVSNVLTVQKHPSIATPRHITALFNTENSYHSQKLACEMG